MKSLKKRWLVLALVLGSAFAYVVPRRRELGRFVDNLKRYSAPGAALYDAIVTPVLGGFYARVAEGLAAIAPAGRVLEIGSGPGRLAVKLGALAPDVQLVGVDIDSSMVARANALAARSGVANRVHFQVGDVAALPFPDATFDVVVSTLSLHHWENQAGGLAEIYRVLRRDGVVRIYDVVDWIRQFERRGPDIAELVRGSPFADHGTCTLSIAARLGPIPLIYRADLRREAAHAPSDTER